MAFLALVLPVLCVPVVRAQDGPVLVPAEPVLDTSPPTVGGKTAQPITVDDSKTQPLSVHDSKTQPLSVQSQGQTPAQPPTRVLNGGITRTDKRPGGSGKNASAAVTAPLVPHMTAEEYRRLEYGIIGFNAELRFNVSGPVVTNVFPSCPAANAGIKPGDILVSAGDHTFQVGDGQEVLWRVVGGKADTAVAISVLRDGVIRSFPLIRMNIEDIKDDRIRAYYENLLGRFGAPGEHTAASDAAKATGELR